MNFGKLGIYGGKFSSAVIRNLITVADAALKDRLKADLKQFMKFDKQKVPIIKSLISDITYSEKASSKDSLVLIIQKAIKRRQDSVVQYKLGKREDLATSELMEIDVLKTYLPDPISKENLSSIVQAAIKETQKQLDKDVLDSKDLGKVMKHVNDQTSVFPEGSVDKKTISLMVKDALN